MALSPLNSLKNRGNKGLQSTQTVKKKGNSATKSIRVGDICNLKITALAANNIGIDEYSFAYAVFVPNAKIGSQIKAKIVKVKESSYAVAKLLEEKTMSTVSEMSVKPGDILTVSIKKQMENGKAGIVELANNFRLIIPLTEKNLTDLDNVKVKVTRVKSNYGFATIEKTGVAKKSIVKEATEKASLQNNQEVNLEVGSKFTITLPSSCVASLFGRNTDVNSVEVFSEAKSKGLKPFTKGNGKFVVLNVKNSILFLQLKKGTKINSNSASFQKLVMSGNLRVRIKITSKSANCLVGKIVQVNPISKTRKTAFILKNIGEMINHGMHFGEKAVKCNARMKNYIWLTGSRNTSNNTNSFSSYMNSYTNNKNIFNNVSFTNNGQYAISNQMTLNGSLNGSVLNRQGSSHGAGLNSKPLIKKGRHVINLLKTRRCLNQALNKVTKYALKGRTFLFIGTKKAAAGLVARASFFTKNSFYVNTRWLGGMLTNWKTICKSISKIRPILKEKQKVVRNILERRQAIKTRLIKKALLLKQKSKLILSKGRVLLETLKKDKFAYLTNAKKLSTYAVQGSLNEKRSDFITKGMKYTEKRQQLIQKRKELIYQSLVLKEKGLELSLKHKGILNQLAIYAKKLREYKYLLILTSEIQNIKNVTTSNNVNLFSVSYGKLKEVGNSTIVKNAETPINWILPNPPKEFLNRMVVCASLATKAMQNTDFAGSSTPSLISNKSNTTSPNASKFIVCSTLLSKFSNFNSYIKSVIKSLIKSIQSLELQAKTYSTQLNEIKKVLQTYLVLKQKYVTELQQLKFKFIKERSVIRIVKRKLKALEAQKKLLNFLPRLKYLPTPQTKISEIVQILLSRIVDPKLKYPIENIYDQKLSTSSKKLAAARKKKWQRLEKYFGGIANMTKLTKTQISRNVAIIIGQKEEMNAVRECQKLGIKMFTIVDTNCNPTLSDHIIPANDDSRSSIKYILTKFITRIRLAQKLRTRLSIYMAQ